MRSPFDYSMPGSLAAIPRGPAAILPAASLAISAAGTAASVMGQSKAGSDAAGQANQSQAWQIYQQQVQAKAMSAQAAWARSLAQQRQVLAQRGITDSLQRGEVAAKENDVKTQIGQYQTAGAEGTARARLASLGTDFSTSSGSTDALGDIAARGEFATELGNFDTSTIRANATREAYGHSLELTGAQNDEAIAQAQQDNAKPGMVALSFTPGTLAGPATALAGASNLASKWWSFQQQGGFGVPSAGGIIPGYTGTTQGSGGSYGANI